MSEQPGVEEQSLSLATSGDVAFGELMDFLVADAHPEEAGADGAAADAGTPGAGSTAAAGEGAGAAGGAAAAPAGGAGGQPGAVGEPGVVAGGAAAAAAADGGPAAGGAEAAVGADAGRPAEWTASAVDLTPRFGELSTKLEQSITQAYQDTALEEVRTEYSAYFDALEKHPRLLVGVEVPSAVGEGTEVLRDSADAKDWQDAVKALLVDEVRDRAQRELESNSAYLTTLHSSVELFQSNADLVPGTKEFDVELANRFVEVAQPYELRVDGKLHGYSIPVQPIITSLRQALKAERAAGPAPATAATQEQPKPPARQPQAGITSKAGASGKDADDFSTLFGTLGLPNLRI